MKKCWIFHLHGSSVGCTNDYVVNEDGKSKQRREGLQKTTRKAGQELTSKPICHWATFQRFWKREYPLLRLPKPSADICSDCHVYHNRFRYTTRQQGESNATSENHKYFKKVTFMFYIFGHTKNAAYRWFNMLKKAYRRLNLFTYEQLLASMKTHERIAVRKVNTGDFQDFDAFLNSFYKKLKMGQL